MIALEDYTIISDKVTGHLTVTENTQYNIADVDSLTVNEGVKARLYGNINQLLVIKKNSKVFLHGNLLGKVQDEGGRFYHFNL